MSRIQLGILTCAVVLVTTGSANAAPPFDPPGPPPWANGNGNAYGRSVPIPSSDLLFGLGLAALAWLGPKIRKG